ncbi:hypothetical protein [Hymenobacter sp. APR13]|uniref:hypothetical protein n=1 Tax=Hymenobacter sp. APR13 TaxID=1356852 RepID=UPI0004E08037|nr:hypothetical protein [Hymenobacter sp. APR13]AII52244.1 hypothetical protein N008_09670 [Hymenobacter sp. APR13]
MTHRFLLLLLGCGVVAVVLAGLLVGFGALLQPQLDIQLHNTYIVLPPYWLVLALLLPLLLLALAGTALWRRSPHLTYAVLVVISLLLLLGADYATDALTQLAALAVPPGFPAGSAAAPACWLLLARALHLAAIVGVGYGCYQLGRRAMRR